MLKLFRFAQLLLKILTTWESQHGLTIIFSSYLFILNYLPIRSIVFQTFFNKVYTNWRVTFILTAGHESLALLLDYELKIPHLIIIIINAFNEITFVLILRYPHSFPFQTKNHIKTTTSHKTLLNILLSCFKSKSFRISKTTQPQLHC